MLSKVPSNGRWIIDHKYLGPAIRVAFPIDGKVVDIASHEAGRVAWTGGEIRADLRVE